MLHTLTPLAGGSLHNGCKPFHFVSQKLHFITLFAAIFPRLLRAVLPLTHMAYSLFEKVFIDKS
jgi:hypothetical protein